MSRLPGVPNDIALLTGPMLLGNLFGYGLYGVFVVQLFVYHYRFPHDPIWLRTLVWFLFVVDTIITIFATITAWNGLAVGWGDPATLAPLDWPFGGLPFLSGLVASAVHLFFSWRIWKLRKSMILPIVIALISITAWVTASFCGIRGRTLGIVRINELKPFVIVWLGGSTIVDVLITVAMVTTLFQASHKSSFQETTSSISKLITLTVETGMATALGALSELVLFLIFPSNNMHFLPFLMLAKLYSNTLLTTLNSRAYFGDRRTAGKAALWNDDSRGSRGPIQHGSSGVISRPTHAGVQISTVTERREDLEMFALENNSNYGSSLKKAPLI